MKIKTIVNPTESYVTSTLAHPAARLGRVGHVRTIEITNVPDDFPAAKLCQLWDRTCDVTWLRPGSEGRFVFAFNELGEGVIIRS